MTNRRMFLTMLAGAVLRRRSRALAALLSSAVGAVTLFSLAAICLAIPAQMSAQMRQFGANLIVVPYSEDATGARISPQSAQAVTQSVAEALGVSTEELKTATYRYETVRINKSPYLLAGIDVEEVHSLNGHWSVQGQWPTAGRVLVGLDVAEAAGLSVGSTVSVEYLSSDNLQLVSSDGEQDQDSAPAGQAQWRVAGIVDTGGKEDGIIYALAEDVNALTGVSDPGYDIVEYSIDTSAVPMDSVVEAIQGVDSAVRAEPVAKITSGDTRIITMLNTLFWVVSLVVLALTLVGVSTTMTVVVSERRNEIGLRKALGASSAAVSLEFYSEAAVLGLVGGVIGTAVGHALAVAVSTEVFDSAIGFNWWLAAISVLLTALVAVIASYAPVRRAARIDPAIVLREE
ncbi:ABC transporter permease [Actinomyces oricola]|uniref:ABC transporter permease n=1 Tax=Actinomyces oricola TaxID=206043 RepID=UPI0013E8E4AF|nr:ABC transporter permease [Actinomyces oricola]